MIVRTVHLFLAGLLFHVSCCHAQHKAESLSLLLGNAPWDFKIGWYEIDNESFDNHDVEQIPFSLGLKYTHTLNEAVHFTFRASWLSINLQEYQIRNGFVNSAQSIQNKYQVAPGVNFIFATGNSGSFYGGFELPIYFHGKVETEFINKKTSDPLPFDYRTYSIIPSGFTAGAAPLIGFTYHLGKHLLCLAEFSTLITYGRSGGKTITYSPTDPQNKMTTQDKLIGLFYEPRVSMGIGYRF
ncbi:MAG TPA: hypothetical protein PLV21_17675 [Cyclobacteriaceae bacterium]|nr:hypothetical protein [Cyclobacteriaceae bacterium]HRJ83720.1 hypothetical protein [Cyclobacteriaceae bacterium]